MREIITIFLLITGLWTHYFPLCLEYHANSQIATTVVMLDNYRDSHYSFGYPACPNIQDQYKQLDLLDTKRINMYMDESEQLYPEQSTERDYYLSSCGEIF